MSDLYKQIDTANQFTAPQSDTVPVKDQSAQSALGLEWAARQATRETAPPPQPMIPIMPVAS
jgi:hypothetical protein